MCLMRHGAEMYGPGNAILETVSGCWRRKRRPPIWMKVNGSIGTCPDWGKRSRVGSAFIVIGTCHHAKDSLLYGIVLLRTSHFPLLSPSLVDACECFSCVHLAIPDSNYSLPCACFHLSELKGRILRISFGGKHSPRSDKSLCRGYPWRLTLHQHHPCVHRYSEPWVAYCVRRSPG